VIINYDKLMELLGVDSYSALKQEHKTLVEDSLCVDNQYRDEKWTESIAVGSKEYVERVKSSLGALSKGRTVRKAGATYHLREPSVSYNGLLGGQNVDTGGENGYLWDFFN
jgi:putative transposase